jgi:hypothetical protein
MLLRLLLSFSLLPIGVSWALEQGARKPGQARRLDGKGGDVARPQQNRRVGPSDTVKPGAAQDAKIRDGTSNTVKPGAAQGAKVVDGTSNTVKPGVAQGQKIDGEAQDKDHKVVAPVSRVGRRRAGAKPMQSAGKAGQAPR